MPNQPNQPGQSGQPNQSRQGTSYKVTREFKDASGKSWKPGQKFEGDEQAAQQAKAAGNISEDTSGAQE
jgi:hypothetical protein